VSDPLPAEVAVIQLPGGVRYRLPRRPWGPASLMGVCFLVSGLLGTAFLSIWLCVVGSDLPANGLAVVDGMTLLLLAGGGLMLVMSLGLAGRGLSRLVGHGEVELRNDTLGGFGCWGPVRWGRRRPVAGLVRFDVCDASTDDRPGRVYEVPRAATEYNRLVAVWTADAEPVELARGYPREWLVPLARDLARRCGLAIDVTEEPLPNPAGFVDLPEQPADSRLRVEPTADGLRLSLPPGVFGRRPRVLVVLGDRLRVERGEHQQEWARRQLAGVRVGRLVDSEGPDTFQVHIDPHPGEGKRVRLTLGGEAEARWLATTLRHALGLADDPDGTPAPFLERPDPPAGCNIRQEPRAQGVHFVIPPIGYRHPDVRRYLMYGLAYLAGALALAGFLSALPDTPPDEVGLGGLFRTLWLLPVGLGLGVFAAAEEAVRRAHRHATLTVKGARLVISQTTLYGTRERTWRHFRIADVHVGDTLEGQEINPRTRQAVHDRTDPTFELHVHLTDGQIVRLLDGYGDADLQWLATALRRALGVPAAGVPCPAGPDAA
jgi:hypothetical protein